MGRGTNKRYLEFSEVRMAAAGRWEQIHRALGIQLRTTSHQKHTPCPGCGGKDRFRVSHDYAQTGRFFCSGGGDLQSGDGFALLQHVHGWSAVESLQAVAEHLGLSSASDKDLAEIKRKAEAQAVKMRADARRKDEQARRDSNMVAMLEEMLDAIKYRQHAQRTINSANGRITWTPTEEEVQAAQCLNAAILDAYANQTGE